MKKLKALSIVLLIVVLVTTVYPVTVKAAVKMNKSKATMYVGDKITLKLSGTTKTINWSTSNKKIATVSSKGKVTAKKEGTATITAKVNNKKYTCKITVMSKKADEETIGKLSIKRYDLGNGILCLVKNNYDYTVSISETADYYDGKTKVGTNRSGLDAINAGMSWVYKIAGPQDSNNEDVKYTSYKTEISITRNDYGMDVYNDGFTVSADMLSDSLEVKVTDNSTYENIIMDCVSIKVVYYLNGDVVGYAATLNDGKIKEPTYFSLDLPKDSSGKIIIPDNYEIYVVNISY